MEHRTSALSFEKKNEKLDLAGGWWLWKWFLTNGVTKRLFNPNLENGVVYDQRASQPQSWWKVTKGFLNLGTGAVYDQRASLP